MSESLTEGIEQLAPASNEPTGSEVQTPTAESSNQDTNPSEQSQGSVSDDTAQTQKQTQENESGASTDDGLAKFAKGQGIDDLSSLSERELKLLKSARDSQKAYRENTQAKVTDAAQELNTPKEDATEVEKLAAQVNNLTYSQETDRFWSREGVDRAMEPKMVEILNGKKEQFGKEYAFTLSRDLDLLYKLAQIESGSTDVQAAKDAGRQEERDSIRRQAAAGNPAAHAVTQSQGSVKIDRDWIANEYKPGNPEHEALMAEAFARGDLY